jgi:very-short-patch-repair endonuclease
MISYGRKRRYYRRGNPAKYEKAIDMRNNPTNAEAKMYQILYSNVVPKFPQHLFYRQSVKFGYILDFYCPTLHLGIEVDGSVHDNRKQYDTQRDNILAAHGIHIFRFSNDDVLNNSLAVASDICQIVETRSRHRGFVTATEYQTNTQTPTTATTLQTKRACFIATAAYGTPTAKEIDILRRFRDFTLERNCLGRGLVMLYYTVSPSFARIIAKSEKMKTFIRLSLNPIIHFLELKDELLGWRHHPILTHHRPRLRGRW